MLLLFLLLLFLSCSYCCRYFLFSCFLFTFFVLVIFCCKFSFNFCLWFLCVCSSFIRLPCKSRWLFLSLFFPFIFFILFYLNKTKNSSVQLFLNFQTANNSQQSSELHIEHRQEKRKTRTSRLAVTRLVPRRIVLHKK